MDDLGWGLFMTAAGMGTVFALLLILMGLLLAIGAWDRRSVEATAPRSAWLEDAGSAEVTAPVTAGSSVEVLGHGLTRDQVAAVALAVTIHERVRRAQAAPAMRTHQPGSHLYASRWVSAGRTLQNTSWRRK